VTLICITFSSLNGSDCPRAIVDRLFYFSVLFRAGSAERIRWVPVILVLVPGSLLARAIHFVFDRDRQCRPGPCLLF
jgi:hypothetical protein